MLLCQGAERRTCHDKQFDLPHRIVSRKPEESDPAFDRGWITLNGEVNLQAEGEPQLGFARLGRSPRGHDRRQLESEADH